MSDIPKSLIPIVSSLIAQFAELQAQATLISAIAGIDADDLVAYAYDMATIRGTTIVYELGRIRQKVMNGEL